MIKLPEYLLERVYLDTEVLGSIYDPIGSVVAKTLELPWKDNEHSISCIPEGSYRVVKQPPKEGRNYWFFRVMDVPGRQGVLMHIGNDPTDSRGCILVGGRFTDYNTAKPSLGESTVKLKWMTDNLPSEFTLTIRKK